MNTNTLSELLLYRYRYVIAYTFLALLTVGLMVLNITTLPPGLSHGEEASAVASSQITLDKTFLQTVQAIDLPYHLLQKASLHLFGLGTLGVRLPSIILAILAAYFLFLTLRRWFQTNVAVVMGLLVSTSSWFHSVGRIGTPGIMIVFWTTLILFMATLISQETKHYLAWKALIVACVGLSFYTPSMAYVFVAALIATTTQPHLRYLIKYDEKMSFFLGLILLVAITVPLGWQVWRDPGVLQTLLAIPIHIPDPLVFASNIVTALSNLVNPFHYTVDEMLTPLISIPGATLIAIGLVRVMRQYHAVRSHVLLLWLAVLVPVIGLEPDNNLIIFFVPAVLLSAIGLQALFGYWYKLFPYNPYARIFGLVPLGVLLVAILQFNYQRYFIALPYAASTVRLYDPDPLLLHGILTTPKWYNQTTTLVVPAEQVPLYAINHDQFKNLSVVSPAQFVPDGNNTVIAKTAIGALTDQQRAPLANTNVRLVVDDRKDDALRFWTFGR